MLNIVIDRNLQKHKSFLGGGEGNLNISVMIVYPFCYSQ
jgi:hypothetical protein